MTTPPEFAPDHFHAYAHQSGLDYRAACVESWMGAIAALRQMGVRNKIDRVPVAELIGPGDPPRFSIQREAGNFDDCQPGE